MRRVVLLCAFLASLTTFADTETVNGITWTYTVSNGKASVGGGSSSPAVPKSTTGAITIPSTLRGYRVTNIGDYAFFYCTNLVSVVIPSSVTNIGDSAFFYCTNLVSVTIPDSVTSIESGAFYGCRSLTSVTIPSSVKSIGTQAFRNCSGLTSMTILDSVTSIESGAFYDCSGLTSVTIPGSVTNIGSHAFYGCTGLTSVTIPDGVTSIEYYAFASCSGLTSVTIPSSVKSMNYSFSGCTNLTSVTILDGVTSIWDSAFSGCHGLTSLTIPDSVTSIGNSAFSSTGLTSVTIPERVTSIGNSAFSGCHGLTSLTIPDNVTSIGNSAFQACSGLTSLTIPAGVTSIEYCAFASCSGLTSVTIPERVTSIGSYAFSGCSGLTSVTIPSNVRSIGKQAFRNCSGLTSVSIPRSVTSIGEYAFSGCSGLTSVSIPRSVTSIGDYAFRDCSELKEVVVPGMFQMSSLFPSSYTSITNAIVAEGVTSIEYYAFAACSGLTSVTIPRSVTSIGVYAFSGCSGLTSVTIPDSVTSIGEYAFRDCTQLSSLQLPLRFKDNISISSLSIPNGCSIVYHGFCDLTVSSEYGSPNPYTGKHTFEVYTSTNISCVLNGVETMLGPGERAIYTGWTGTGNVPASGTGTNMTVFLDQNSTLKWNWKRQNQIAVTATGLGNCSFGTKWVNHGTTTKATIVPSTHLYSISLSGDSDGVTLNGTTLTIPSDKPRQINVTVSEVKLTLGVSSDFGTPSPAAGSTIWSWGTSVSASIVEPDPVDGVRQRCTGWTGTGSVPASGMATNVSFTMEEDSTLTWNWETNVWIECAVTGGVLDIVPQWVSLGSNLVANIDPDYHLYDIALSGDTDGVVLNDTTLTIPADRPRTLAVVASAVKLSLDVASEHGDAVPNGRTLLSWGDMVDASVQMPPETNGIRYVCTGWTGTGSAPASGTSTNIEFAIEEDSTLTWLWERQNRVSVDATGKGTCSFGTQWIADGTTAQATVTPTEPFFAIILSGNTNDVTLAGTSITIPSDGPRSIAVHVLAASDVVDAGENALNWRSDGTNSAWRIVADENAADGYSLRSAEIGSGETSAIEVTVDGTGVISFDWRISSGRGTYARFYVDGAVRESITRMTGWSTVEVALGDGPHTLRWTYEKGSAAATGEDAAFLDNVRWTPLTLASALNATNLVWTTEGDAPWFPQLAVSADGVEAVRSGAVVGEEVSRLLTTVSGAGTLSWTWRTDVAGSAGVDVFLDGEWLDYLFLDGSSAWATASLAIEGDGDHSVVFEFWNAGTAATLSDCAYLDCVSWTPATPAEIVAGGVSIPASYFDTDYPSLLAAANGDYEAAANATAANGVNKVWECYVAGLDPTNPTAQFLATITMGANNQPEISHDPPLPAAEEAKREYRILGAETLDAPEPWDDVTDVPDLDAAGYRFFKVTVEMKE